MQTATQISLRVYRCSLWLYPKDLRKRFGPEMFDVFAEMFANTWAQQGMCGVVSLWWMTLAESIMVGLSSRLQSTVVIAGVSSFCVASLIAWFFFCSVG